jgi:hypothetical protein
VRPADFARAVYRFQPHVKRLESFPAELALLRAADAYALSVLKTPDSAAVKVARHYARTLFEKPAEADAPSPLPPRTSGSTALANIERTSSHGEC